MSGRAPRQKGTRFELSAVHILQDMGVPAQRIPLSGSAGGEFVGDITTTVRGEKWTVEAKCRDALGFKQIYGWLGSHKALFIKRDRSEPLVVLRLTDFAALAKGIE